MGRPRVAPSPCDVDGCDRLKHTATVCMLHYKRMWRKGSYEALPKNLGPSPHLPGFVRVRHGGYVRLACWDVEPGQLPIRIMEHRVVMEQKLGRPLLAHENVHHINGVRDDNRPENLELWSSMQPSGQRVEDKVAWAREVLALYSPESLTVL